MVIKTGIIPKIAFSFLNINIYWYAVLITIAIGISIIVCKKNDGRFNIKYSDVLDCIIILIPISIVGARLYYVIFNLEYFLEYPLQILNFRNGGLALYGGIVVGSITCYIYCRKKKIKLLDLLDYIVPCVALSQSIGRWGNYINIEAYGTKTNLPIKMEIIENGVTEFVHPTFLYESTITFILFIILSILSKKRKVSGQITYLYIIIYSFARIFIENLRTDSLMIKNYKISQILSIVFFVVFSLIFILNKIKCKNQLENTENCRKK